jgi:hypothetical protein
METHDAGQSYSGSPCRTGAVKHAGLEAGFVLLAFPVFCTGEAMYSSECPAALPERAPARV